MCCWVIHRRYGNWHWEIQFWDRKRRKIATAIKSKSLITKLSKERRELWALWVRPWINLKTNYVNLSKWLLAYLLFYDFFSCYVCNTYSVTTIRVISWIWIQFLFFLSLILGFKDNVWECSVKTICVSELPLQLWSRGAQ